MPFHTSAPAAATAPATTTTTTTTTTIMPGTRGPVPVPVTTGAHHEQDLTLQILQAVDQHPTINTSEAFPDVAGADVKAALDRLASRSMIAYEQHTAEEVVLTGEGQQIAAEGSHEYRVWEAVRARGRLSLADPALASKSAKIGQGKAFALKWVGKDGDALVPLADAVEDATRARLLHVAAHRAFPAADAKQLKDFQKRQLVTTRKVITYEVRKGPRWAAEMPVEVTDLTAEMLADGSWQTANFKPYNFAALGEPQMAGSLHPLGKVREEFRKILFNMGFTEMPTGR